MVKQILNPVFASVFINEPITVELHAATGTALATAIQAYLLTQQDKVLMSLQCYYAPGVAPGDDHHAIITHTSK